MRKSLRRGASLLVSLSLCVSAFAGLTAQGFEAKVNGWTKTISDDYYWMADATDEEKQATRDAMADELVFQNDTLGFRLGTNDGGSTTWNLDDQGWVPMVHIQMENYDASLTDNVGSPWPDQVGRLWCIMSAPFVGTAFVVKGQMATSGGGTLEIPALSDQFDVDGATYQQMWNYVRVLQNGSLSSVQNFPGMGTSGQDITGNRFRSAVAVYNQNHKRDGADGHGLFAGYASGTATITADGTVVYQELVGPSGTAYVAGDPSVSETVGVDGAYVIPAEIVGVFNNIASDMDARFAITGYPTSEYADGRMDFSKGYLTASGFHSTACSIVGFSFGADEAAPSVIDEANHTITAYVQEGANLSSLTPEVEITGTTYTPTGAQNFTSPVTYTVTAAAGNTQDYTVTVVPLNEATISTFAIGDATATIDYTNNAITIAVHSDVDLSNATPEVTFASSNASMSPASGLNLENSWDNPVEVTVTAGSATTTYTIRARYLNTDTRIVSFVIPEEEMKYAWGDVVATIDHDAKTITMEYAWGNFTGDASNPTPYARVPAEVVLPSGATISPDPTVARDQLGQEYTVTSENGDEVVYTVHITVDTKNQTFPPVDDLGLYAKDNWGRFSGDAEAAEFEAILEEYNYQRSIGFDPGTPTDGVSNWDDLLSRQLFIDGSGQNEVINGATAMIAADVSYGKAYTLKNTMVRAWQIDNVTDPDGISHRGWSSAGSPVENEFVMEDGLHYQQFSMSYGTYDNNGNINRVLNGVGTSYNDVNTVLEAEESPFYDVDRHQVSEGVRNTIRDAYEGANMSGTNPGIALDGPMQYDAEHHILYQVFSGTGEFHSTERNSSNKTIIIKGLTPAENEDGEIEMTANGSAIALIPEIQYAYENINFEGSEEYAGVTNEYEDISLAGFNFKYSTTLGMPNSAPKVEDGVVYLEFAKGYATYVVGSDEVTWTDGSRFSNENHMASIEVEGAESYEIFNADDEGNELGNAVRIHFPSGVNVDLTNIVVNNVVPVDANATVEFNNAAFESGTAIDMTFNGTITVVAEDGSGRRYSLFVWQDGQALSQADPAYGNAQTPDTSDPTDTSEPSTPSGGNNNTGGGGAGNSDEDPYEYGYYDENGVWHNVTKEFYERWSGNNATGEAGVVGVVLLTAAAAGALVVLRKKK